MLWEKLCDLTIGGESKLILGGVADYYGGQTGIAEDVA